MMRAAVALISLLLLLLLGPAVANACTGDCDEDGVVALHEVVRGVGIALGTGPVAACRGADADGDGAIAIDELIGAVDAALNGCCGNGSVQGSEECDDANLANGDGCSARCQLEPGGDPCAGVATHAGTVLRAELFASVDQPVHITAPPLDPQRVFIVEQPGRIRIVERSRLLDRPFLDIVDRVSCCGERGLLGLAFHPDFERNGRFFVNYTNRDGDTVIARYRVGDDPNATDPASEEILITIDQPFPNHNGGQVAFGPDGFLYTGMGDGGSQNDPRESGQNDGTLLGKLLRFDVAVAEKPFFRVPETNPNAGRGAPLGLIWAKGLRNPWRFSFDRATGDLYIGDVGQFDVEEIDVQPADSAGGENYGWDVFEGSACFEPAPLFPSCPEPPQGFTFPVVEYDHDDGCSVTGGFVYRGCALPELRGTYFYADYCTAFVRSFVLQDGVATRQREWTADLNLPGDPTIEEISSFGEDARGELYVTDLGGEVYKLVPAP